ncbi:hypothetical protein HAX54_015839 [Datura stramonium]|uniref:Red chlorophyll catabolite reductase n=1 Tax=Datura stramonium TaxID=4076 RepID=A0ABS8UHT8_DATST|nr:hypothetical protein [Datura stramonium]
MAVSGNPPAFTVSLFNCHISKFVLLIKFFKVDFILGSWVHCNLPTGGALNITSLSAYLRPSTDAPNFLIEVIRSSPTALILILDLPPRKDLVQHPDYLKTFYEETQLDKQRQFLEKLPEVKPYFSSSLYIRALVSPSAILVSIETEPSQVIRIDEIIRDHITPVAKVMLNTWLDLCACAERRLTDDESTALAKRDRIVKNKTIEIDLESSFPRLFGQEVANRQQFARGWQPFGDQVSMFELPLGFNATASAIVLLRPSACEAAAHCGWEFKIRVDG